MSRSKRPKPRLPKYAPAVAEQAARAQAAGLLPGLYMIDVRHDDWCALLKGTGQCNCNPEVHPPRPYFPPENN